VSERGVDAIASKGGVPRWDEGQTFVTTRRDVGKLVLESPERVQIIRGYVHEETDSPRKAMLMGTGVRVRRGQAKGGGEWMDPGLERGKVGGRTGAFSEPTQKREYYGKLRDDLRFGSLNREHLAWEPR